MKKIICLILVLSSCLLLSGCFEKVENEPVSTNNVETSATNNNTEVTKPQENESEIALSAIKEALKDEEWVKNNLMLKKSTFGEDAGDDQVLTFKKLGKDRVIVNAYAYDQTFGIANTIVSYKDGEVKTFSEPSLEAPHHPGHIGYAVDPVNEVLVLNYMHMGFYESQFSKILDDKVELIASFQGTENNVDGTIFEDENGTPMVEYTIKIGDNEDKGSTTFEDYENRIEEFSKQYKFEAIDTPLTAENIDKISI